jgi:uncharacterized protein (DUF433 family)
MWGDNTVKDQQLLERITLNPKVMVGKAVIKGTRLTIEYILNLLAHGVPVTEIMDEYEGLTHEDVQACLSFWPRGARGHPINGESTQGVASQALYVNEPIEKRGF